MLKDFLKKIVKKAAQHKIIAGIIVIVLIGIIYFGSRALSNKTGETSYVLAAIEKGTLIVSVSGSGQVSASNQADVQSKVAGEVLYANIKNGQEVKTGTLLAQIDTKEAQKTIRDAETNLETAKLSLEKLKQPADELSILQAENTLAQAIESEQNAKDNLSKGYEDGFNTVANTFLDLPTIMTGLQDILFGNNFSATQPNMNYYADAVQKYDDKALQYREDTYAKYEAARQAYDQNFANYKEATRLSATSTIEDLINQTYETTRDIAECVKSANNLIQFYKDTLAKYSIKPQAIADTHLSSLNTYTSKTNSFLSTLLSAKSTIESDKKAITNAQRSISEKTESLANLKAGPDALDLRSQELTIEQRENALVDAKEKLNDYFIRAPFDGVIVEANIKKGDSISASTVVATIITKQRIAEISLNEVDVAKVKVGQKVTLTFDAVEELSITGEVLEVDTLGTVAQGVVTYNVKIGFDAQDERVKPGMSVSAAIITEVKQDVLLVPNSAVKSSGDTNYVETLDTAATSSQSAKSGAGVTSKTPPRQQTIQIGLANDSSTEVISGLKEGELVVTQTIDKNNTTTSATQIRSAGFGVFGGSR